MKYFFAPNSAMFRKSCGKEEEGEQENVGDLGVSIQNLQTHRKKSKSQEQMIKTL